MPQPSANLVASRRLAALAIAWERLWPLVLPVLGVIAAYLILSGFGLWPLMPTVLRLGVLTILGAGLILALLGLRRFSWPDRTAIDHRIEAISDLRDRPVTAQIDRPADLAGSGGAFAKALWQEHQNRMALRLKNLKSGTPNPDIARRDPFALRSLVVLVLFVALFAGWNGMPGNLADAFRDHAKAASPTGRIDAWITPPAYTNKPPLFLSRAGIGSGPIVEGPVTVPEGSELVIRVLRMNEASVTVRSDGKDMMVPAAEKADETAKSASETFKTKLKGTGTASLMSGQNEVDSWSFTITPDEDPKIEITEDPAPSSRGALEFAFAVEDDYGVARARAEIRSNEKVASGARPLVDAPQFNLPLPGRRSKKGTAKASKDLSDHPWAGGDVTMTLIAEDDAGQIAKSSGKTFNLPGRIFTKPLARAVVFERRQLALDANRQRQVAEMLDIITSTHPDVLIPNVTHYTALRVATRHIKRAKSDEALLEGLDLLWDIALAIEDGDLSLAERRLRDAQERLADALERGASDEEISRLMDELRQAMAEFMRQLAEQMAKNPQNQQALQNNQNMQTLRQQDLDRMMQQIEDLAKSGSPDAARELLRQLQEMMNNLQMARPGQNQQQNDPFSEQMNKLGEMMRKQQELMDQTFDMQRRQNQQQMGKNGQQPRNPQNQQQGNQGQQNQQQNGQGQRPMTAEEFAEAMRKLQQQQSELQKQMEEMQQAMRDLGLEPGERMGDAGREMGEAGDNLQQGQPGPATENQGRALQAMREGAQDMMREMQQQAGEQGQRGQRGQHGEQSRSDQDPLGRQSRSRGPQLGDDVKVPGEIDAQRARKILEAIRKRLGETARPKLELDYLNRLLPTR